MIRLLLLLIAGLALVAHFADDIGGDARRADSATGGDSAAAGSDQSMTEILLAALTSGPAAPRQAPDARQTAAARVDIVPFMHPIVVGADGRPVPQAAEPVAVANAPEPDAAAPSEAAPERPVGYVTAARVNVRSGPSTSDPVIGSVDFADAVELLSDPASDWVRIRIEGDGVEGYMASRFLADEQPQG